MLGYVFRALTSKSPIQKPLSSVPLESVVTTGRDFPLASRVDVKIALDETVSAYRVSVLGNHSALGHETPLLAHLFMRGPFPFDIGPLQHDNIDIGEDIPVPQQRIVKHAKKPLVQGPRRTPGNAVWHRCIKAFARYTQGRSAFLLSCRPLPR
jgi:hypothetical protein